MTCAKCPIPPWLLTQALGPVFRCQNFNQGFQILGNRKLYIAVPAREYGKIMIGTGSRTGIRVPFVGEVRQDTIQCGCDRLLNGKVYEGPFPGNGSFSQMHQNSKSATERRGIVRLHTVERDGLAVGVAADEHLSSGG